MSSIPLDFDKVESLRGHMFLSMDYMAKLLGVSRQTYHGWGNGKPIRAKNEQKAKVVLKQLVLLVKQGDWPPAKAVTIPHDVRFEALLELLAD